MGRALDETSFAAPAVLWLGDPRSTEAGLVGGKAAQLSALAATHPVPEAFCVTTAAYAAYERTGGVPPDVARAAAAAYRELAARSGDDPARGTPVAVRSSAVDEDGTGSSFAGQHDTYLNVTGEDVVLAAVAGVWRSARGEAALGYRRDRGLGDAPAAVAVLVQRLVSCDASGVAFSVDPVASDLGRVVISASWGLGESLMAGDIDPDRWVVDKASLSVIARTVGAKQRMTITDDAGTRQVSTPTFLRQRASLSDEDALAVAGMATGLEARLGHPVDVEFALADDGPVLLQCRPVTTLAAPADASGSPP